ncbi:Glycine-rich RNA-binding protein 2 [Abeliophyllum distichum]|uniref:Glycine-rich RNA-binding protein 2 n=1 Tax=Abeliophyllum distichum TaxID=126358 RepID=A0ABD1Q2N6_9LAMI
MHFPSCRLPFASPLYRWLMYCHSSTKLFVGGLSYDTNEPVLKDAFDKYGEVIQVNVVCDHVSGKSKGYGFVHYAEETAASKALKEMDGQLLEGRNIRVQYSHRE